MRVNDLKKTDNYNAGLMLIMLCMDWDSCWTAFLKPEDGREGETDLRKIYDHRLGVHSLDIFKYYFDFFC